MLIIRAIISAKWLEQKVVRACHVNLSNQFAHGKCPFSILRRGKNLSKAECVKVLAKELIENEEWAAEKSDVDENEKN